MKIENVKIENEVKLYLYEEIDLEEGRERLIESMDTLIRYLSKQKEELKKWTVDEMTNGNKLFDLSETLDEGIDKYDDYDTGRGLFVDVKDEITSLSDIAQNMNNQDRYKYDIANHWDLFR